MNRVVKVPFTENGINDIIKRLEKLNKNMSDLGMDLAREIAYDGLSELNKQYANTPYQPNSDTINTSVERSVKSYSIVASGKSVIYDEFGTGDIGASNSHPEKSEYPLNDYNSGKTIRNANEHSAKHGITSGKYWTYEKDGQIYYTQGIPAGKQMYNTRNYIINEGIKKAKDKVVGDLLSKL